MTTIQEALKELNTLKKTSQNYLKNKTINESENNDSELSPDTRKKLNDFHKKFKEFITKYKTKDGMEVTVINIKPKDWINSDLSFIDDILSEYPEFEGRTFDISFIDDDGDGNFLIDDEGYCFVGYPAELYPIEERAIIKSIERVTRELESENETH